MRTATELDAGELDASAKPLILLGDRAVRRGICDPLLGRLDAGGAGQAHGVRAGEGSVRRRRRGARATPGGFAHPRGARPAARALSVRGHRA